MSKYIILSLLLHALILFLLTIDPIQKIFYQNLQLQNLSHTSPPTLQIIAQELKTTQQPQIPSPTQKQVVYTDFSNAREDEVRNSPFESAHNTRLTTTETPTPDASPLLPKQTGDPNMGISISPHDGNTNVPLPPPTPNNQSAQNNPTTPSRTAKPSQQNLPPQPSPSQDSLPIRNQQNTAQPPNITEEREAQRPALKKQALEEAQRQLENSQETNQQPQTQLSPPSPQNLNHPESPHTAKLKPTTPRIARARSNIHGGGERSDQTSIGSRATPVGRYKNMLYREVGSRWNQEIDRRGGPSILPLGSVRIAFTVKHTGEITDVRVIHRSASSDIITLENLCLYAIRSASPFQPFDQAVREQLGDSYTEEFTFTIYR